ncbi:MAG: thioredoxin family protein [Actinobacteria bacterium]|nr:thioredoxin family protein [Actinomycetota bacterium]
MIGESASKRPNGLRPGAKAPPFALPGVDGEIHSLPAPGDAAATVIVFTCNHCPYALAWHDRVATAARDYADRNVRFFAINANDATRYPADSFEAMRERAAGDSWPMPYLHDADQRVARAYDAQTTPDLYVFDRDLNLVYSGAPDADFDDLSQNAAWLRDALDATLAGAAPDRPETGPVGCSIKWRE